MKKGDFVSLETIRESNNLKNKNGITLIALIITIIVLLILAGVSIATITGENGLLERARIAKETTDNATSEEQGKIAGYENEIDNYVNGTREQVYVDKEEYEQLKADVKTLKDTVTNLQETSGGATYNVIYDNSSGSISDTLNDSIENYDYFTVIFGTPMGKESENFTNVEMQVGFNFASDTYCIYGHFDFSTTSFTRTIVKDSGGWSNSYKIYKVIGVKFNN